MALVVRSTAVGLKLNQLEIFDGQTLIGEYERAQEADIERKKKEVQNAEALLLAVFRRHGPFVVRWDRLKRAKSIRVNGVEVGVIPSIHWERPSWKSVEGAAFVRGRTPR